MCDHLNFFFVITLLAKPSPTARPRPAAAENHQPHCYRHSATHQNVEEDKRLPQHVPGGSGGSAEGWLHGNDDSAIGHAVRQRSVQVEPQH